MGFKTDQCLSYLITVETKFTIFHLLDSLYSKKSNFFICEPWRQQKQTLNRLKRSPLSQGLVSLSYLNRIRPINRIQIVDKFVRLMLVSVFA